MLNWSEHWLWVNLICLRKYWIDEVRSHFTETGISIFFWVVDLWFTRGGGCHENNFLPWQNIVLKFKTSRFTVHFWRFAKNAALFKNSSKTPMFFINFKTCFWKYFLKELKILTLRMNNTSSLAAQILKSPCTDLCSETKSVQGTPLCWPLFQGSPQTETH